MSELDARGREERHRVMLETADRLRQRGVSLTGHESSDELVSLLDAVEEYERLTPPSLASLWPGATPTEHDGGRSLLQYDALSACTTLVT